MRLRLGDAGPGWSSGKGGIKAPRARSRSDPASGAYNAAPSSISGRTTTRGAGARLAQLLTAAAASRRARGARDPSRAVLGRVSAPCRRDRGTARGASGCRVQRTSAVPSSTSGRAATGGVSASRGNRAIRVRRRRGRVGRACGSRVPRAGAAPVVALG
jgi:hypothetical protein